MKKQYLILSTMFLISTTALWAMEKDKEDLHDNIVNKKLNLTVLQSVSIETPISLTPSRRNILKEKTSLEVPAQIIDIRLLEEKTPPIIMGDIQVLIPPSQALFFKTAPIFTASRGNVFKVEKPHKALAQTINIHLLEKEFALNKDFTQIKNQKKKRFTFHMGTISGDELEATRKRMENMGEEETVIHLSLEVLFPNTSFDEQVLYEKFFPVLQDSPSSSVIWDLSYLPSKIANSMVQFIKFSYSDAVIVGTANWESW